VTARATLSGTSGHLGPPIQIAYAVPDVHAAAARWAAGFGAGPFFVREHIELVDVVHRGRPARFDHSAAYGQWGTMMIELVQDHGTTTSVVRDMYAHDETGAHHVAFAVQDIGAALKWLQGLGHGLAMSARTTGGTEFCFVDTVAECGHMLELYERSERLLGFYEMVAAASRDWDGSDAVRPL